MPKKRPCRMCGKWFEPHPRAGDRQRTCSEPECQRERNRKACRRWRAKHDTPSHRLRRNIRAVKADSPEDCVSPVTPDQWRAMRHAVQPEVLVVLQELVRLLDIWMRHAVATRSQVRPGEPPPLHHDTQRRANDRARPPP